MIANLLFHYLASAITWLFSLLPTSASLGLPSYSSWVSGISDSRVWGYFSWANWYMPLDLAVTLLGIRLALWAAMYVVEFTIWALTKVHVLGGAS